jgi:uncharacterized membrane protein
VVSARVVQGIDVRAVELAVRAAERRTSCEIRVAIPRLSRLCWGDVHRSAERAFTALHMERTRERNGVLLYVAPRRRRFAVVGDVGVHARVATTFWVEMAQRLATALRDGDLTTGLNQTIAELGERLAPLFPIGPDDVNELPDAPARP